MITRWQLIRLNEVKSSSKRALKVIFCDENALKIRSFSLRIMTAAIIWCAHYSNKSEKIFGLFRKIHKIRIIAAALIRAKTVAVYSLIIFHPKFRIIINPKSFPYLYPITEKLFSSTFNLPFRNSLYNFPINSQPFQALIYAFNPHLC
jgi:hypothetical protein